MLNLVSRERTENTLGRRSDIHSREDCFAVCHCARAVLYCWSSCAKKMHSRILALCSLTVCSIASPGLSQQSSVVAGTVEGINGAPPMVGASVALYSARNVFETKADANGAFKFSDLPPDTYELQTVVPGFRRKVVSGILVPGNRSEQLDVRLESLPCYDVPMSPRLPNYKASIAGLPIFDGTVQTTGLGKVLPRARVDLLRNPGSQILSKTSTDNTGSFSFQRVSPGKYTLIVTLGEYSPGITSDVWLVSGHTASVTLQLSRQGKNRTVCE